MAKGLSYGRWLFFFWGERRGNASRFPHAINGPWISDTENLECRFDIIFVLFKKGGKADIILTI